MDGWMTQTLLPLVKRPKVLKGTDYSHFPAHRLILLFGLILSSPAALDPPAPFHPPALNEYVCAKLGAWHKLRKRVTR